MKTTDVIKQVATLLQLGNVLNANFKELNQQDSQTKKDINLILSCINEVLCDVATDFLPIKKTVQIQVENNSFDLSSLPNFHKLIKVFTTNQYSVNLETLSIPSGSYKITYQKLPDECALDGQISDFLPNLTIYALSYGVASQYCTISGNYSEAEMWHNKFADAMQVATRKSFLPQLKQRRWL